MIAARCSAVLAVIVLAAGCPRAPSNKVVHHGDARVPPHKERVCMLEDQLSLDYRFSVIGSIRSDRNRYGSVHQLTMQMADQARKLGADAVINLSVRQVNRKGPGPVTRPVRRPIGTGTAIKLAPDQPPLDCIALGGTLY